MIEYKIFFLSELDRINRYCSNCGRGIQYKKLIPPEKVFIKNPSVYLAKHVNKYKPKPDYCYVCEKAYIKGYEACRDEINPNWME